MSLQLRARLFMCSVQTLSQAPTQEAQTAPNGTAAQPPPKRANAKASSRQAATKAAPPAQKPRQKAKQALPQQPAGRSNGAATGPSHAGARP